MNSSDQFPTDFCSLEDREDILELARTELNSMGVLATDTYFELQRLGLDPEAIIEEYQG